jgi:hypothetical protein
MPWYYIFIRLLPQFLNVTALVTSRTRHLFSPPRPPESHRKITMAFYPPSSARSPPPLQHPVPTHPLKVPEPPATPVSSEYQRYVSTPQPPPGEQQQQGGNYGTPNYYGYPSQPGVQQQHSAQRGPTLRGPIQQQGPQAGQQGFGQWGGFNMEGATAQLGLQLGQNAVAAGQEYVTRSVCSTVRSIYLGTFSDQALYSLPFRHHSSNITSTFLTHMYSRRFGYCYSRGDINRGHGKSSEATRRAGRTSSISRLEKISIVRTCTSQVSSISS